MNRFLVAVTAAFLLVSAGVALGQARKKSLGGVLTPAVKAELTANAEVNAVTFRQSALPDGGTELHVEVCGSSALTDGGFEFSRCYQAPASGQVLATGNQAVTRGLEFWKNQEGL